MERKEADEMKRPLENALWRDCETDEERAEFFRSGRAFDTGVIAKDLAEPLAYAFEDATKWRAAHTVKIETSGADLVAVMLHALKAVDAYFRSPGGDDWIRFHNDALVPVRKAILWAETAKPAQPWGPDAVPLMVCPGADNREMCFGCFHKERHPKLPLCDYPHAACPRCVQVGWRERSKWEK